MIVNLSPYPTLQNDEDICVIYNQQEFKITPAIRSVLRDIRMLGGERSTKILQIKVLRLALPTAGIKECKDIVEWLELKNW